MSEEETMMVWQALDVESEPVPKIVKRADWEKLKTVGRGNIFCVNGSDVFAANHHDNLSDAWGALVRQRRKMLSRYGEQLVKLRESVRKAESDVAEACIELFRVEQAWRNHGGRDE
jgi:hypothetical protein